jgi:hypothetical protein
MPSCRQSLATPKSPPSLWNQATCDQVNYGPKTAKLNYKTSKMTVLSVSSTPTQILRLIVTLVSTFAEQTIFQDTIRIIPIPPKVSCVRNTAKTSIFYKHSHWLSLERFPASLEQVTSQHNFGEIGAPDPAKKLDECCPADGNCR